MRFLVVLSFLIANTSFASINFSLGIDPTDLNYQIFQFFQSSVGKYDIEVDNPRIKAATNQFGFTKINLSQLPYKSPILDTGTLAWSSWYYPKKDHDFTKSDPFKMSILEKYDLVAGVKNTPNSALEEEVRLEDGANIEIWEGLCDAAAIAGLSHREPVKPVSFQVDPNHDGFKRNISFTVSDLKGLLLKTYDDVSSDQFDFYGEKFTGDERGWYYPDLLPEQFHRLIEVVIGQKKMPFIYDREPGPEVWSLAAYRANYNIERIPGNPNSVLVHLWVSTAMPLEVADRNVPGNQEDTKEYNYILTGDLTNNGNTLIVKSGTWVVTPKLNSMKNHPDFVVVPKFKSVKQSSKNSKISIPMVEKILEKSY